MMKRLLKKLLHVAACLTLTYYCVVVTAGLLVRATPADVAVVLGNEVMNNGKASDRLLARVDEGVRLYRAGLVKKIMVSGGKGPNGFDEATVMAERLREQKIPEGDIIVDSLGVNSFATAVNAASMMREQHWSNAVIVTQYFHIPRTEMAFYMAGVRFFTGSYPWFFEWRDLPSTLREMVAIPVYWFTKPHQENGM